MFCLKEIIDNLGHRVEVFLDSKEKLKNFKIIWELPFNSPDFFYLFNHKVFISLNASDGKACTFSEENFFFSLAGAWQCK